MDTELNTIKVAVMSKMNPVECNNYPRFGWDNPKYFPLETPARSVIGAYQNANKWLDTIKEHILINLHLPYFSHIVHTLAHTMPARFDQFGDILHKENLLIQYPDTLEWVNSCGGAKDCIHLIYDILDQIKVELVTFKKIAEDNGFYPMSIECDPLLTDIQAEYEFYYRIEGMLESYGPNLVEWDRSVHQYYSSRANLI